MVLEHEQLISSLEPEAKLKFSNGVRSVYVSPKSRVTIVGSGDNIRAWSNIVL